MLASRLPAATQLLQSITKTSNIGLQRRRQASNRITSTPIRADVSMAQQHQMRDPGERCGTSTGRSDQDNVVLAVVGDVHGQWYPEDEVALKSLGADFALFVGDFGEEDVPLVRRIAAVDHPKAVILGNHDGWYTVTERGRRRNDALVTGDHQQQSTGVTQQQQALAGMEIGYSSLQVPGKRVSIVGGRPFSQGGDRWRNGAKFYAEAYGVDNFQVSAKRIAQRIAQQPPDNTVVVLAHNGPTGLGDRPFDICGQDWTDSRREGLKNPLDPTRDHGDPDLEEAVRLAHRQGRGPALVVFGHMHSQLQRHLGMRRMVAVNSRSTPGTVYLNTATMPRIRRIPSAAGEEECPDTAATDGGRALMRHFCRVHLAGGRVVSAKDVWVRVVDREAGRCEVVAEQTLLVETGDRGSDATDNDREGSGRTLQLFNAFTQQFEPCYCPHPRPAAT